MERKKARIIDDFVRNSMSPLQKAFMNWARYMRDQKMFLYGERVKAGFALFTIINQFYRANKIKMERVGM
jgi:hypothetical protein